jgi:hypothetical protein
MTPWLNLMALPLERVDIEDIELSDDCEWQRNVERRIDAAQRINYITARIQRAGNASQKKYWRIAPQAFALSAQLSSGLTFYEAGALLTSSSYEAFIKRAQRFRHQWDKSQLGLNRTTGHSYTQAASCEHSPSEGDAVASAWTAAVTSGV